MTDEKRSRVLGMMLACVSQGAFPQREPVAFLYGHVAKEGETPTHTINGVGYVGAVAPKLPEVDGYDNAVIMDWYLLGSHTYKLTVFKTLSYGPGGVDNVHSFYGTDCLQSESINGGQWSEFVAVDDFNQPPGADMNLWTNVNLLNEDGTVALAASEPVPVYE